MTRILGILVVLLGVAVLPSVAQSDYPYPDRDQDRYSGQWRGRLSADDQREFNEHYEKWQKANAENDRDDINKYARKMEETMARYQIPPDTPFDVIATSNGERHQYDIRQYQGRFSPEDQKKFDHAYEEWLEHRRKHDRDDVAKEEGKMLEIMSRYNIPRDVPYDALASGARGY
jgi:hypothetical protein